MDKPRVRVVLDVLDWWTALRLWWHHRGSAIDVRYHLYRRGRLVGALIAARKARGWSFEPARSFFDGSREESYLAFNAAYMRFAQKIEAEQISRWLTPFQGKEDSRTTMRRHITFDMADVGMPLLEYALSVLAHYGDADCIYLQRTSFLNALMVELAPVGGRVVIYRAPLRQRFDIRPDYAFDKLYTVESLSHGLKVMARSLGNALYWLATGLGAACRRKPAAAPRYHALALAYHDHPNSYLNDLFWSDAARASGCKVLAAYPRTLLDAQFNAPRVDGEIHIGRPASALGDPQVARWFCALFAKALVRLCAAVALHRFPLIYAATTLRLLREAALFRALIRRHGILVTTGWVAGKNISVHALKIAGAEEEAIAVGGSWTFGDIPRLHLSHYRADVLCCWGTRQAELFRGSGSPTSRYLLTGYPTGGSIMDEAQCQDPLRFAAGLRAWAKGRTMITVFDEVTGKDLPEQRSDLETLILALIDKVRGSDELCLLIKTKGRSIYNISPTVSAALEEGVADARINIVSRHADLSPGVMADVIVGLAMSTPAYPAAALGSVALMLDRQSVCSLARWPDRPAFVTTFAEIADLMVALDQAIQPTRSRPRPWPSSVDAFADGHGHDRIGEFVADLASARDAGLAKADALAQALQRYAQRHGTDRVIQY